jgi:hypothetical protein
MLKLKTKSLTLLLMMMCCTAISALGNTYVRLNQIGFDLDRAKTAIAFSSEPLPDDYEISEFGRSVY